MSLKPLNSQAGFSVGTPASNIILANGDITTTAITVSGVSNLGPIGNVIVTGGSANKVLSTNGSGSLSWANTAAGNDTQIQFNNTGMANGSANFTYIDNVKRLQVRGDVYAAASAIITFTNPGDESIDYIDTNVAISRPSYGTAFYNPYYSNSGNSQSTSGGTGPTNTLWNIDGWADLSNITSRTYQTLTNAMEPYWQGPSWGWGGSMTIPYFVMKDTLNNKYYKIKVSVWGSSGSFTYTRQEITSVADQTVDTNILTLQVQNSNVSTTLKANSSATANIAFTLPSTDGDVNQILQTDGSGNLSWTSTALYATTANSVAGANVTGAVAYATTANSVAGANVSGQVSYAAVANSVAGANVSGTVSSATSATTAGTVTTAAQPNITSVGTLTSLGVSGTITASRLVSNIATGTAPFTVTSTTQVANLSVATAGSATTAGTVTTAAQPNITSVGTLTSLTVSGNTTVGNLIGPHANGNSNVNIPAANGNVNISAVGNANILVVTGTGVNVSGTLNATGDANVGNLTVGTGSGGALSGANSITANYIIASVNANLGAIANVTITGGSSGNALLTYGNGTLYWGTAGGGGTTTNAVTFNNGGAGAASGTTFDGSSAVTVSYNTVGAPSTSGTNATGTWGINVTGSAGSATTAGTVTTAAQPNITSVGTLTSLGVQGSAGAGKLNVNFASGSLTYLQAFQSGASTNGNLQITASDFTVWAGALGGGTTSQALQIYANRDAQFSTNVGVTGNTTSGNFIGILANTTSNVKIPAAAGNVTISVGGTANIIVATTTGANITGYVSATGVIVPRVATQSAGTTITTTTAFATTDVIDITSVSSNFTLTADAASSGTYYNGQRLMIRLAATASISITVGTGGTKAWNQIVQVPGTMTSGQTLYVGAVYNSNTNKWDIIAARVG